jgi:hypothetical protein
MGGFINDQNNNVIGVEAVRGIWILKIKVKALPENETELTFKVIDNTM